MQNMEVRKQLVKPFEHATSDTMERYSTSADEWDTVGCFIIFQEIEELPKNMK